MNLAELLSAGRCSALAQRLVHTGDFIRRECRASPRNANDVPKIFGGVTALTKVA